MRHVFYYVVKPNAKLSQRIADIPAADRDAIGAHLGTPMVLQRSRSSIPHELLPHHVEVAKLAFVADFYDEYLKTPQTDNPIADFLHEIWGQPPYGVATFNNWWEIDVTAFSPQDLATLEKQLSQQSVNVLGETSNLQINAWINSLKSLDPESF